MRECLRKSKPHGNNVNKDVRLKLRKAGLSADGEQRWQLVFSLYDNANVKITATGYAAVDIDWDESRVYFVETEANEGWKLIDGKSVSELSLTIYDYDAWKPYEGEYVLLKDKASNDYYIDLVRKEVR